MDRERFPLVVDSDPEKVGTFVPGTGQEIRSPEVLREAGVEVVIVPMWWRAKDVLAEMRERGTAAEVWVEAGGGSSRLPGMWFRRCEGPRAAWPRRS